MKKITQNRLLVIVALCSCITWNVNAQLSFTNANVKLTNSNFRSGCSVTVTDVNNDGLDDIVRLDDGHLLNIELQKRDGDFTNFFIVDMDPGGNSAWAMTVADVDHNGFKDVVADGQGGIQLVKIYEVAGNLTGMGTVLTNSGFFLQNATFLDANNDGWIDLFCCDDNDASHIYLNDGAGNLNTSTFIDFALNPTIFYGGDPADSGNYGSSWIDFDNDHDLDLFVAHCRQSSSSTTDLRRKDRLFVNDGNNNFTEQSTAYGLEAVDYWQTWTSTFGDIDNDGDLDVILTNHDHASQVFENDGTGHYTELLNTGFHTIGITPIESAMEDFDNDGYIDIIITGSEYMYFHNNGNKTFTQVENLFANNGMLSFAFGDLNHDGFIDIYASYGNIYTTPGNFDDVIYLNNRNAFNHFITFNLEGTLSNKGAIGGRATIYGPWGVQVREVRSGESYGTCNSSALHFGLGLNTVVDSAEIWFPSGNTTMLYNLNADQFVTVIEGTCVLTGNSIPGPYAICTGQTLNLTTGAGFATYDWTSGDQTQSIVTAQPGIYNVLVTDGSGCSNISPSVNVEVDPDETPSIITSGEVEFCAGNSVTLTGSAASSYSWSNGGNTQSINVAQSGNYTLTIQGLCAQFTSQPVSVNVVPVPSAPVTTGASASGPASVVLTATGTNIYWYDQQTGGNLVGSGSPFNTPVISSPTIFWAEDANIIPGAIDYTGQKFHSGSAYSGGSNTNGSNDFNVMQPATLVSVKVYTDSPGDREIQLKDAFGTVLQSKTVYVPMDSSRITLNFPLVAGSGFQLTTNPAVNQTTLGTNTPRLQRSNSNVAYPYTINNLVSITGSNQGSNVYYYFYDWEVQEDPMICASARTDALADVTVGVKDISNGLVKVSPNPASDNLYISLTNEMKGDFVLNLIDVTGRLVFQKELTIQNSDEKIVLNVEPFAKGTYLVKLITNETELIQRVVIN